MAPLRMIVLQRNDGVERVDLSAEHLESSQPGEEQHLIGISVARTGTTASSTLVCTRVRCEL